jgi:hypothetical protein
VASSDSLFQAAFESLCETGEISPADENALRVMSAAGASALAPVYSGILVRRALAEHAAALIRSAEASEKHAVSLKWATWALVIATIALGAITAGLWLFP